MAIILPNSSPNIKKPKLKASSIAFPKIYGRASTNNIPPQPQPSTSSEFYIFISNTNINIVGEVYTPEIVFVENTTIFDPEA